MTSDEIATLMNQFLKQRHDAQQCRQEWLKTAVIPGLANAGVHTVVAEYSGYGDSGAIDGLAYLNADGKSVENLPADLPDEELRNAFYEFLPGGFEINEGGQGIVTLHVQDARVTLQHEQNVTEVLSSSEEFDL